jgi:hypothetical protein
VSPVSPQSAISPAPTRTGSVPRALATGDGNAAAGCCETAPDGEDVGIDSDGDPGTGLEAGAVGETATEAAADLDARGGVEIAAVIEADAAEGSPDEGAERAASDANPKSSASVATKARTASGAWRAHERARSPGRCGSGGSNGSVIGERLSQTRPRTAPAPYSPAASGSESSKRGVAAFACSRSNFDDA